MVARQYPGFVRNARGVGSHGDIVAARFNHARGLALLLVEDVAEDAALLADKIFAARPQFVEHTAGHKQGCGDLRRGMAELLASAGAEILEQANVLYAGVALEVQDALGGQAQELPDLIVTGEPEMAVVAGV